LVDSSTVSLVGWLVGCFVGGFAGWLIRRRFPYLVDSSAVSLVSWSVGKAIGGVVSTLNSSASFIDLQAALSAVYSVYWLVLSSAGKSVRSSEGRSVGVVDSSALSVCQISLFTGRQRSQK
jgi:hypothetical protein